MLELRLKIIRDQMEVIIAKLNTAGIKCNTICTGFASDKGFYITLPGSDDWMRGKDGIFLRPSELVRLEILFRKFRKC